MISGFFPCTSPTACGAGDTCLFPVRCLPGDCVGDPVCTAAQYVVDYCDVVTTQPVF
jgi:hypothetical protein